MKFAKTTITLLIFLWGSHITYGQFSLPNLDYDTFELVKNKEKKIHKGVYSTNGKVKLEAHYPIDGSIQSYCYRTNVVYDSVYIYYGKEIIQIYFHKNRSITKNQWKASGRVLSTEMYGKDKQLKKQFTQYTELNKSNPAPPCSYSHTNYNVGTSLVKNEDGSGETVKNYDTGEINGNKNNSTPIHKKLQELKPIADKIVKDNYGKKFFKKNIQSNYYSTGVYHENSRSYHRNKGIPNINLRDGWFQNYPDSLSLLFVDFTYDITFSEEERYSIIRVRLDKNGNLVEGIDNSTARNRTLTKGLLLQPAQGIMQKKEVLKLAIEQGLRADDKDLQISLLWKESSKHSSKGELLYELTFNKTPKKVWGCSMVYFDKWIINPVSKEIDTSGEDQSGECMEGSTRVQKGKNGKYGVASEFKPEPLISFTYDYLQRNMSYFLIAKKQGNYGIIDHKENILLPFEYEYISWLKTDKRRFKEEFCKIKKGGSFGLASKDGVIIEEPTFTSIKIEGETIILTNEQEEKKIDMRVQMQKKE